MNHKRDRRRGNKRRIRRIENKSFRRAEDAALRGDRATPTRINWISPAREGELPVVERKPKKRSKKKLEYCPAREGSKRCHYLHGEAEYEYYNVFQQKMRRYTRRYKMCGYCGRDQYGRKV